mmetsp:Transcript_6672/g.10100  ORF Transcript_6672/g.10100 Transcript_6672/m.10100 type:complete len:192 (-) Transcript_6672:69-644(-)
MLRSLFASSRSLSHTCKQLSCSNKCWASSLVVSEPLTATGQLPSSTLSTIAAASKLSQDVQILLLSQDSVETYTSCDNVPSVVSTIHLAQHEAPLLAEVVSHAIQQLYNNNNSNNNQNTKQCVDEEGPFVVKIFGGKRGVREKTYSKGCAQLNKYRCGLKTTDDNKKAYMKCIKTCSQYDRFQRFAKANGC